MYKNERQEEILKILRNEGYTTVEALSKLLYTSPSSIRRDLILLEKEGLVTRSYGGVELAKSNSRIVPFSMSVQRRTQEKKCIAEKAAALVKDKDIVFLDQSSSSLFLARELAHKNITIMTNSIEILSSIPPSRSITIYSCGGEMYRSRRCFVGSDAAAQFRKLRADLAFFSAKALTPDGQIYDASLEEVLIKDAMTKNAYKKVFLCDSEKFDTYAGYRQCSLEDVDYLISEVDCKDKFQRFSSRLVIL